MTTPKPVDAAFTKRLPKIELHAHLSGSISRQCLHEIWEQRKAEEPGFELEDPLVAMPVEKVDYDINTFFPLFTKHIYHLCSTLPALTHATHSVLSAFTHDGLIYAELRTTPRALPHATPAQYVSTILDCMRAPTHAALASRLILSIDRGHSAAEAMAVVDLALAFRARGVVGVDLCGNPTKGDVGLFRAAFARAKQGGLGVTLHFAEVAASGAEPELATLLEYGPDRIGHVIHVSEGIRGEIVKRRVGLEMCLSCNVQAGLVEGGVGAHHFGGWRERGCPIALCTDDVGVFGSPLSNEFLLAAEHFELSREGLVGICGDSIGMIFGGEEQKSRLRGLLVAFGKEENLAFDA